MMKLFSHHQSVCACVMERMNGVHACMNSLVVEVVVAAVAAQWRCIVASKNEDCYEYSYVCRLRRYKAIRNYANIWVSRDIVSIRNA